MKTRMQPVVTKPVLWRFCVCEDGAVAVEYSVIAGAMFLALTPAFYILRDSINVKYAEILTYLQSI
jgi:Flp pilus assembly pilin Flp